MDAAAFPHHATSATSSFANTENVTSLAFRPDGRYIAAAANGRIKLWDAETGRHAAATDFTMDAPIRALQFSPDSSKLIASVGGALMTFDGSSLRKTGGHLVGRRDRALLRRVVAP